MLWQFTVGLRVERQADRIVVDAEDAHLIEKFCVEIGLASFHTLKIVPLSTFNEDVIPTIKRIHGL